MSTHLAAPHRAASAPSGVRWRSRAQSGGELLAFVGAVWLYNHSGGSILLVALWHGGYNPVWATAVGAAFLSAVSTMLVIAAALALVVIELARIRSGLPSVLSPQPGADTAHLPHPA